MEERFRVGVVTQTHGVKGEVKVFPTTSEPSRFKKLKSVIIENKTGDITLEVESAKFFKQFVILKFRDINSIEDVTPYLKKDLLVERKDAIRLRKNEFFYTDLIGMTIQNEEGMELGVLTDVIETGANDCYEIELKNGEKHLIPAIRQCVLNVDVENKLMTINVLEGLF